MTLTPHSEPPGIGLRLLDVADFAFWWDVGGGRKLQMWNLKKPIPGHPEGSTVTRETLINYFRKNP